MAFTPENYLMAERAMDQVGIDATAFFKNSDRAIEQIVAAATSLAGMAAQWSPAVTFIDAEVVANPGDTDWDALKARKDKLTADFLAMRNLVQSVRDAAILARG